jgi:hypothetical protein
MITAMTIYTILAAIAVGVVAVAFGRWLFSFIKADGYGLRTASGLPRDWSPSSDLPSIPYSVKPHV